MEWCISRPQKRGRARKGWTRKQEDLLINLPEKGSGKSSVFWAEAGACVIPVAGRTPASGWASGNHLGLGARPNRGAPGRRLPQNPLL